MAAILCLFNSTQPFTFRHEHYSKGKNVDVLENINFSKNLFSCRSNELKPIVLVGHEGFLCDEWDTLSNFPEVYVKPVSDQIDGSVGGTFSPCLCLEQIFDLSDIKCSVKKLHSVC